MRNGQGRDAEAYARMLDLIRSSPGISCPEAQKRLGMTRHRTSRMLVRLTMWGEVRKAVVPGNGKSVSAKFWIADEDPAPSADKPAAMTKWGDDHPFAYWRQPKAMRRALEQRPVRW